MKVSLSSVGFFKERRDNSLLKPVREGMVYDVGDRGEENFKAFLDDESRARI